MQKKNNSYSNIAQVQKRESGFTLIEIMIALVIVSVGVVAVMTATAKSVEITAELERRVVASWVVSNQMAEIRHESKTENISNVSKSASVTMGGYEWRVKSTIEETELDRVFLVTVEASDQNQKEDQPVSSITSSVTDKL